MGWTARHDQGYVRDGSPGYGCLMWRRLVMLGTVGVLAAGALTAPSASAGGYGRLPEGGPANEMLESNTREYPNLRVIDFAVAFLDAQARGVSVGWLDGVHMNEAVRIVRVEAIVEALAEHRRSIAA